MMMMMMIIIIIIIVERVVVNCQLTSKSQLRLCAVVYVHQPRDAWGSDLAKRIIIIDKKISPPTDT